jgi:ribosome biogenesis protein ERB1
MLLENEKNSNIEKLFNEISVKEPWEKISGEMPTIFIPMEASPRSIAWHSKGDYFATVSSHLQASVSAQIIMHCLSKSQSQKPFKKNKGLIQAVAFHPFKAYFFVATQTNVFMYNLEKQLMAKKFYSGSKWISSICIHPSGNNFIVGTYDKKTIWFDVDYGSKPYKVLKYQSKAVRKVDIHSKYPIFASAADDGTVNIFHGMVYEDYSENALILPLNILDGHKTEKELGVMSMCFHPQQPWVFSGGADGKVILWV